MPLPSSSLLFTSHQVRDVRLLGWRDGEQHDRVRAFNKSENGTRYLADLNTEATSHTSAANQCAGVERQQRTSTVHVAPLAMEELLEEVGSMVGRKFYHRHQLSDDQMRRFVHTTSHNVDNGDANYARG
jgi:hypothetical protein